MVLSTEKAEKFTKYLTDDLERAKKLFALPLSVAVGEIRLDGMDYTEEELKEYVEYIQMALSKEKSEFDESNLDGVFGGICAKINLSVFAKIMGDVTIGWIR